MAELEGQVEEAGGDYVRAGELERERAQIEGEAEAIFELLGELEELLATF
jgi:hypothetical protein